MLAAMRPDRQVTCQVCGKSFTAKDGRAKFCSNACKQRDKYRRHKLVADTPVERILADSDLKSERARRS
jgi:predicted nucleic acid-binding Zn ribbon protein